MFALNSINCLFVSDTVIDIDLGLIRLISKKFTNSDKYFYKEIIDLIVNDKNVGKYLLYQRKKKNPLTVISKEDVSDEILDSFYNEFIEKYYDDIIDLAEPTDLMEMVIQSGYSNMVVTSTILCKNERESEIISAFASNFNSSINVTIDTIENIDLDTYDTICIKNYDDIYRFKPFYGKSVIVSNAEWNYITIDEANFHELNPIISIYLTNNDNELSKIEMYRTLEIDDNALLNNNIDKENE